MEYRWPQGFSLMKIWASIVNGLMNERIVFDSSKYFEKAGGILLPHQLMRVNQIWRQQNVKQMSKNGNEFGIILRIAYEVGLDQKEIVALKNKIEEGGCPIDC